MAVDFDWTVRLTDIVTWVGLLGAGATYFINKGKEETVLEDSVKQALLELTEVKKQVTKFNEVASDFAVQKMQIALLMKWYDELRRGEGFVQARMQRGGTADGEY